jgi:predicted Zn-dependent peptidase
VAQLALHGLPDAYFEEFIPRLAQVTQDDVSRVASQYLDAGRMTTLIVGDLDKIAESLPGLGLGPHQLLTPEL